MREKTGREEIGQSGDKKIGRQRERNREKERVDGRQRQKN